MQSVLIIDNERTVAEVLKLALMKHGYNVETACNGKEGAEKFDEDFYDFVITDILMPGLDGNNVVRYIRQSTKPLTPVIGISGTPWLLEKNSFDAVLVKPFSIYTMLTTIQNCCHWEPRHDTAKNRQ
jgi:CheY-like chemotaxis protein